MTKAVNKPDVWLQLLDIAQIRSGQTSAPQSGKDPQKSLDTNTVRIMMSATTTHSEDHFFGTCGFGLYSCWGAKQCLRNWD